MKNEKIHKWKIYSFSERMFGRAIRNRNQNLPRGGLLFCKIFRISTNDYDDRWNRIRIYICEVIHECKFFFAYICEVIHNWKWKWLSVTNVTDFHYRYLWNFSQVFIFLHTLCSFSQVNCEPFSLECKRLQKLRTFFGIKYAQDTYNIIGIKTGCKRLQNGKNRKNGNSGKRFENQKFEN